MRRNPSVSQSAFAPNVSGVPGGPSQPWEEPGSKLPREPVSMATASSKRSQRDEGGRARPLQARRRPRRRSPRLQRCIVGSVVFLAQRLEEKKPN